MINRRAEIKTVFCIWRTTHHRMSIMPAELQQHSPSRKSAGDPINSAVRPKRS
jgi:hypothetical protein